MIFTTPSTLKMRIKFWTLCLYTLTKGINWNSPEIKKKKFVKSNENSNNFNCRVQQHFFCAKNLSQNVTSSPYFSLNILRFPIVPNSQLLYISKILLDLKKKKFTPIKNKYNFQVQNSCYCYLIYKAHIVCLHVHLKLKIKYL